LEPLEPLEPLLLLFELPLLLFEDPLFEPYP
jgi:hypothetical protein